MDSPGDDDREFSKSLAQGFMDQAMDTIERLEAVL